MEQLPDQHEDPDAQHARLVTDLQKAASALLKFEDFHAAQHEAFMSPRPAFVEPDPERKPRFDLDLRLHAQVTVEADDAEAAVEATSDLKLSLAGQDLPFETDVNVQPSQD